MTNTGAAMAVRHRTRTSVAGLNRVPVGNPDRLTLDEAVRRAMHNEDLTLANRVRAIVAEIAYRPNWDFYLRLPSEPLADTLPLTAVEHVSIVAQCWTSDIYTGNQVDIVRHMGVPYDATEHEIITATFLLITEIEGHERMEFFKLRGEWWNVLGNPHGPEGRDFAHPRTPMPAESWAPFNLDRTMTTAEWKSRKHH